MYYMYLLLLNQKLYIMNQKEQAFVLAYLKTSDKEEAYRIANNDYHSSREVALSRAIFILQDSEIAKEIDEVI